MADFETFLKDFLEALEEDHWGWQKVIKKWGTFKDKEHVHFINDLECDSVEALELMFIAEGKFNRILNWSNSFPSTLGELYESLREAPPIKEQGAAA